MQDLIFYFDFISPYAYLGAEFIEALAERHQRKVSWRPILLAALLNQNQQRGPAEIPDKRRYTFKNILRLAHDHGLEVRHPPAHPFNPLLPLRLSCLRPELILPIFRACWRDGQAIDSPEALQSLVEEPVASAEAKQILKDNTQQALEAGVFGVPSVDADGEIFWGFDSFPHLERFLEGRDAVDPAKLTSWERLPASASRL